MAEVGDLVQHRGKWMTLAPTHCPHGHRLGLEQVLVGHLACQGHGGGGHTIWHCVTSPDEVPPTYGPAFNTHCTVMNGPAAVHMSNVEKPPAASLPICEPPFMA